MEVWKDIKGLDGRYQISSIGRVRSFSKPDGKILKLPLDIDGYPIVSIRTKGVKKIYKIHRLVAQTFIPNLYNLPQVNHKSGIKTDNSVENLEWCTCAHNVAHSYATGLKKPTTGVNMYNAKLTDDMVLRIRSSNESCYKLADKFGVSQAVVYRVKKRRTWKHIINN